jgi:hypothetical protein
MSVIKRRKKKRNRSKWITRGGIRSKKRPQKKKEKRKKEKEVPMNKVSYMADA